MIKERIKLNLTTVKKDIIAGITSFFAISYIIIVNPLILSDAGISANLSVFATIFSSALGCLIMALWADSPIIITPGMGVNAFFTYTVVVGMKLDWQQAVAISIFSSLIYLLIAFSKVSDYLAAKIPASLKTGITVGIGLFLVTIGLEKAHLIKSGGKQALLAPGNLTDPTALLSLAGLIITLIFFLKKIPGGFILGIISTSLIALVLNIGQEKTTDISLSQLGSYGQLLFKGDFSQFLSLKFLLAVFSMTMILVFESMGILEGLLTDKSKFKRSFQASAVATFMSGFLGTSPTVAAAESASGIESGGKSGVVSLTAGLLFLASLFGISLLAYVPEAAIAPVIIITGALMMKNLASINYNDFTDWFPSFLIIVLIPLTGSISTGLAFGFVSYPLVKLIVGKYVEVEPVLYLLGSLFLIELICNAVLV
ncbi:xanthine/uracil/vitamin C permease [Ligilactobacillus agilis]|uniref:Xanthine/uracil/vitamin C permease n=1 Tax=Ligilactobacillus agilis TaxID=1601 RepID=A0A6F9Y5V2_9LACO|nr:NCS2 family permease [Ligilactobacillus agilis]GET12837.1 xanthine/uracil/vitamin C permease [Ligilactobacillus agilis]